MLSSNQSRKAWEYIRRIQRIHGQPTEASLFRASKHALIVTDADIGELFRLPDPVDLNPEVDGVARVSHGLEALLQEVCKTDG